MIPKLICATLLGSVVMTGPSRSAESEDSLKWMSDLSPASYTRNEVYADTLDNRMHAAVIQKYKQAEEISKLNTREYPNNIAERRENFGIALQPFNPVSGGLAETVHRMGSVSAIGSLGLRHAPLLRAVPAVALLTDKLITDSTKRIDADRIQSNIAPITADESRRLNDEGLELIAKNPQIFRGFEKYLQQDVFTRDPAKDPVVRTVTEGRQTRDRVKALEDIANGPGTEQQKARAMIAIEPRPSKKTYALIKRTVEAAVQKQVDAAVAQMAQNNQKLREAAPDQNPTLTDEDRARSRALQRELVVGPAQFMAGVARLFNDPAAAAKMEKLAQLSDAVFQLTNLTSKFRDNPLAVANLYVFAATTLLDLFQGPQESEMSQVMKELRALAKQMEDFRVEMHARFDHLDQKIDVYFKRTFFDLDRINTSLESLKVAQGALAAEIDRLQKQQQKAFDDETRIHHTATLTKCFPSDDGGRLVATGPANYPFCTAALLDLAFGIPKLFDDGADHLVSSVDEFEVVRSVAQHLQVAPPATSSEQLTMGSTLLLKYFALNPGAVPAARSGISYSLGYPKTSLPNLIDEVAGQVYLAPRVLLHPGADGRSTLWLDILMPLIAEYEAGVAKLKPMVTSAVTTQMGQRPDPSGDWRTQAPTVLPSEVPFLKSKVTFCDSPQAIGASTYSTPGFSAAILNAITAYPAKLDLPPSFFDQLPPAVQWAEIRGRDLFEKFEISACIAQGKLEHDRPNQTFRSHLIVDFNLTYQIKGAAHPMTTVRIAGVEGRHVQNSVNFADVPVAITGAVGPDYLTRVWYGRPDPYTGVRLTLQTNGSAGYLANAKDLLIKLPESRWTKENREVFEDAFHQMLASALPQILDAARDQSVAVRGEINRARGKMLYAVTRGLDMSDARSVQIFKLLERTFPTGENFLYRQVEKSVDQQAKDHQGEVVKATEQLKDYGKLTDLKPAPTLLSFTLDRLNEVMVGPNSVPIEKTEGSGIDHR